MLIADRGLKMAYCGVGGGQVYFIGAFLVDEVGVLCLEVGDWEGG